VEIGPGVGIHAIFLANLIGKSGHLILYESRSLFEQLLRQNLATNGIAQITIMRNRALGALDEHPQKGNQYCEALDELGLSELSLLKLNENCDALSVIDGSTETIWRLRPLLFTPARDDAEFSAIRRRIKDLGYRTWRIETTLFNPQNFNRRTDDIFSGRTGLSLLGVPEEIRLEFALAGAIEILDRALN
jgi:hypothetical protein